MIIATVPGDHRVNERIRVETVRLIDNEGNQRGVVSSREALSLARSLDLDLVEIAPTAQPPVCRIMDYGKFKFDEAQNCLLYTSPSPRDRQKSRMPSSA